jgi:SAM-dependent methyltransferase
MSEQRGVPAGAGEQRGGDKGYRVPHHQAEVDRLDVQHYALLETLGGHFLAPVESPRRILDTGSGTGQWAYDVCGQFPDALVVGLDIEPSKPGAPANFGLVRADLLRGLPFPEGSFDFVHQRFMAVSAIPLPAWEPVVGDLVRVTAPGGWVELVEGIMKVEPAGPATQRLFDLLREVGRSFDLDVDGVVADVLGDHLRRAGLADVEQRTVEVPVGEWGGRAGSLAATDLRAVHLRLAATYEQHVGVSRARLHVLLHAMQDECERLRSRGSVVFAFGRRPA